MKCSKCGNELKSGQNFCTKCGNAMESSINVETSKYENKYSIEKDYNVMWGMAIITLIVDLAFWIVGLGFDLQIIIIELVVYGILIKLGAFANIIFKCPNCNGEITLNQNALISINNDELTCKCPKCNKELILNNKDLTVKINEAKEKVNNTANKGDTEMLEEWFNLKNKGIISEEEFEKKKQELLRKM